MLRLSKKQQFERAKRFEDYVPQIGLTCPYCLSPSVLAKRDVSGVELGPDAALGCWDCGHEFSRADESACRGHREDVRKKEPYAPPSWTYHEAKQRLHESSKARQQKGGK